MRQHIKITRILIEKGGENKNKNGDTVDYHESIKCLKMIVWLVRYCLLVAIVWELDLFINMAVWHHMYLNSQSELQ